jgi:hypothetical protein
VWAQGADVRITIIKYFRQTMAKILAGLTQNIAIFCRKLNITLVFKKITFLPKIGQKSRKIVIVTLTPGGL